MPPARPHAIIYVTTLPHRPLPTGGEWDHPPLRAILQGWPKTLHLEKTQDPPEEARKRFAALVTINELDYKFKLTTTFQKALDDTEAAVTLHYAHPPAPGGHPPAH